MPILPKSQATSVVILANAESCGRFLSQASGQLNSMSSQLLDLDNDKLSEWLNSQTHQDVAQLFAAHKAAGDAINTALLQVSSQLEQSGIAFLATMTDTRDFQQKLAEQGRQVTIADGKFVVSNIQVIS